MHLIGKEETGYKEMNIEIIKSILRDDISYFMRRRHIEAGDPEFANTLREIADEIEKGEK